MSSIAATSSVAYERALDGAPPAPPAPPAVHVRRGARKRRAFALIGLIVGAALAWYGYDWWSVGRFVESTDDAYVGGDVTAIAPQVPGFIAEVAVKDNQAVHKGDLLVRLDERDYRAALDKAEAAVAGARATLADLVATRALQAALIDEARAGISAADAEVARTRQDQVRYARLSRTAAVSVQSAEHADASYKEALADGEKARARLLAAQRQLAVIDSRRAGAEASLAQVIAERDAARLNLGYTELRAPIDGTIGNRSAQLGAYAPAGVQLLSLVPARGLWVDANFKESQLAAFKPGDPATVIADALPGRRFLGTVLSLAPATGAVFSVLPPENATGNFTKIVQRVPVRIRLTGEGALLGALRPGLSVTVEVDTRPRADQGTAQ